MGVQGLWQLLQSTGHQVSLESLAGMILGIDVSMWLHQANKGMRDRHGNSISNAHLILLFRRICKLLYYRIKPVFVFDGGVPILKKQTLAQRRQQREEAAQDADNVARKLASKLLQKKALSSALDSSAVVPKVTGTASTSHASKSEEDIFCLPPLPEHSSSSVLTEFDGSTWEKRMEQREAIFTHFEDIEKIDTESEDFAALPAEIKHEILTDLREIGRKTFWARTDEMPTDSDEFSKYQLNRMMKQSRLTQHMNQVRKELSAKASGDIALDVVGNEVKGLSVETSRLFSDDSSHYFLIKGLSQMNDLNSKIECTATDETSECAELNVMGSRKRKDVCSADDENEDMGRKYKITESMKTMLTDANASNSLKWFESVDLSDKEMSSDDEEQSSVTKNKPNLRVFDEELQPKLKSEVVSVDIDRQFIDLTADRTKDRNKDDRIVNEQPGLDSARLHVNETMSSKTLEREDVVDVEEFLPKSSSNFEPSFMKKSTDEEKPEERSESDSSDDEGFIEVEPDLAYSIETAEGFPTLAEPDVELSTLLEQEIDRETKEYEEIGLGAISSKSSINFEGITQTELLKMQESLDDEMLQLRQERGKQERLATSITDQMQLEAQELLRLFGVPYVVSPMEAEAQCAFLDLTNQTEGTVTDDSDIWLFGGRRVYRNIFNQNQNVEFYAHAEIKSQLLLDREDFVKMALLCGSDYTEGLMGVGPVSAVEILAEFPGSGLESLTKFRDWWKEASQQKKAPHETKVKSKLRNLKLTEGFPNAAVFDAYLSPAVDETQEPFSWSLPDLDLLRKYGQSKLGWTQSQVDELLLPILKSLNQPESSQSSIKDFFLTETKVTKKLKSSRVRNVINRIRSSQKETQSAAGIGDLEKSAKGKGTKGLKTKNQKGTKQQTRVSSSGGFVLPTKSLPVEANLSEESEDESAVKEDEFEISDEILSAIDFDVQGISSNVAATKSANNRKSNTKLSKKSRTRH